MRELKALELSRNGSLSSANEATLWREAIGVTSGDRHSRRRADGDGPDASGGISTANLMFERAAVA